MKVVFAGPSLHQAAVDWGEIDPRPPASQGDLYLATQQGASVIGLIDGYFGESASVWHKEILFALGKGVRLVGGASMGALRAVECAAFGMEPVGWIAERYAAGDLDDDSLVALTHGPAEIGFAPFTDALVDMLATIAILLGSGAIDAAEEGRLAAAARAVFFQHRTIETVLEAAGMAGRRGELTGAYRSMFRSVKRDDALAVVDRVRSLPDSRGPVPAWRMEEPPTWRQFIAQFAATSP
jgi:hypothetical protein